MLGGSLLKAQNGGDKMFGGLLKAPTDDITPVSEKDENFSGKNKIIKDQKT